MSDYQNIGVIGGGAWGTALAQTLAVAGRDVTLWAFEDACIQAINEHRENTLYLKGCLLYTSPSPRDRTRSRMPSSA